MTEEGYLLDLIMNWLAAEHITAWRMNTGCAKIDDRFIRFNTPGFADILALPTVSGKFKGFLCKWTAAWFIEVKTPKGRQSVAQKAFEQQVRDAGAEFLLARSLDDVIAWAQEHGVTR